ncbi:MAG: alpha-amylase family glycosyl hydrolase [Lachnospiraceae bacterium]
MAWYDEAVFYHIYPLGLTGAPKENSYGEPEHRLKDVFPWIDHIKEIGCTGIYIGPLFESVGHGYETTDYKKLDSRLGTNEDLSEFVKECHKKGIKVILDGVFNHTGRDFFAFQDIKKNRENSQYKDWYCNVNFFGNNEYNDGFSYENWGGYNLLVKLNQKNPAVRDYICDVIRFWVSEFDIDGIRLDAADVLDFDYMKALRNVANEVKPDFWLMGEVIHGDYNRWVNEGTLHSVTNYQLHKALYSGHNDHNYFEIAHTVKRLYGMGGIKLYNFVDNHDVERIYTKLNNKAHFTPVHILMYTLPGVPSIYYGSEFGIEGRKEKFSDDSLRPALYLADYKDAIKTNPCTSLIAALGKIRQEVPALSYGDYNELVLTNRQYAYSRNYNGVSAVVAVNNDDNGVDLDLAAGNASQYVGLLSGTKTDVVNGKIHVNIKANSGDIFVPVMDDIKVEPVEIEIVEEKKEEPVTEQKPETAFVVEEKREESVLEATVTEKAIVSEKNTEEVVEKTVEEKVQEKEEIPVTETTGSADVLVKKDVYADRHETEGKAYEDMTVVELQEAVLYKMSKNGPVTDQMFHSVEENVYHDSLVNWVKSFR